MKKIYLFFIFLSWMNISIGQETTGKYFEIGYEIQQYPTGFLNSVRGEIGLAPHHALDFRIGYNSLDHEDFGVHDSEIGGGFGGSLGYRYYFNSENKKWFVGGRTDVWFNEIDWIDFDVNDNVSAMGVTDVVVLQPTLIGGFRWTLNDHFSLTPTVAFGAEINISTDGAEVGEGGIVLWGVSFTYRF